MRSVLARTPWATGEVAGLAGIDADDRQTGRAQGDDHGALVAAAGFQHDAAGPQRLELPLQPPQAAARARHRPGRARGLYGDVQPGLRHIDPYRYVRVWAAIGYPPATLAIHALPCRCGLGIFVRPRISCSGSGPASGIRDDPALHGLSTTMEAISVCPGPFTVTLVKSKASRAYIAQAIREEETTVSEQFQRGEHIRGRKEAEEGTVGWGLLGRTGWRVAAGSVGCCCVPAADAGMTGEEGVRGGRRDAWAICFLRGVGCRSALPSRSRARGRLGSGAGGWRVDFEGWWRGRAV